MAGALERLGSSRATLLLRCQVARERQCRVAVARAVWASVDAGTILAATRRSALQAQVAREEGLARMATTLAGRVVDAAALHALPAEQARQRTELERLAAAIETAARVHGEAEAGKELSQRALAAAMKRTRRRERLAEHVAASCLAVAAQAEEAERDDAVVDSWRPA